MKRQEVSNKKNAYIYLHGCRSCCNYKTVNAVYILISQKMQKI